MNTSTHFLLTTALGRLLKQQGLRPIRSTWWWGSPVPDIPLYLLTLGGWVYSCLVLDWDPTEALRYMFRQLFFQNPFWIASRNIFLHSPIFCIRQPCCCSAWVGRGGCRDPGGWNWP
ncbi:MAG: hypothetical protein Q6L60_00910 [Thermostichus sp. HHBFW_bins_43]